MAEVALAFAFPAFTSTVMRHCPAFFRTKLDFFTEQIFDEFLETRTETTAPFGAETPAACAVSMNPKVWPATAFPAAVGSDEVAVGCSTEVSVGTMSFTAS